MITCFVTTVNLNLPNGTLFYLFHVDTESSYLSVFGYGKQLLSHHQQEQGVVDKDLDTVERDVHDEHDDSHTVPVTIEQYLSPIEKAGVNNKTVHREWIQQKGYKQLDPSLQLDGEGEPLVELSPGMNLTVQEAFAGLLCASVANWSRLMYLNVDSEGKVGYLTGEFFSHLPAVNCLHSVHSPMRFADLNTLFGQNSLANTLQYRFGMNVEEANRLLRAKQATSDGLGVDLEEWDVDDSTSVETDKIATQIIGTVLFGFIIIRTTGRPSAIEQWCQYHQKEVDERVNQQEDGAGSNTADPITTAGRRGTYMPTTLPSDVNSFIKFLKGTCTDGNGHISRTMPGWTGQGDAASIPKKLRSPFKYCSFVKNVAESIDEALATNVLELMRAGDNVSGRRELAVGYVKSFIEETSGLDFNDLKANQVSDREILSSLALFLYCCTYILALTTFWLSVFDMNR